MQCFIKLGHHGEASRISAPEQQVPSNKPSRIDALHVHPRDSSLGRARLERFIEASYFERFGSVIAGHYPTLLGLQNTRGDVLAALGLRIAGEERLFLERYFDEPIERVIAQFAGLAPSRTEILEIGNMASIGRRASARLIAASAMYLQASRCRFAVVTATDELRTMLGAFGFTWERLAAAQADRLPDRGRSWGRYYKQNPEILIGEIRQAPDRLQSYTRAIRMEVI